MRRLEPSTEVCVGSDQSCVLISPLGRSCVSGSTVRVFAPGGVVLQPAAVSDSHYHLLVLFNQGIKSFQDGNYNYRLSGMSSGTGSARGHGSDSAPILTASAKDLHSQEAESKCKGTWLECRGHRQKPREYMEGLDDLWNLRPCKGRLPEHKHDSTIHKHSLNLGQERQLGMLQSGNCNLLLSRKM